MKTWRLRLILAMAGFALLLAACGGDSPRPEIEAFGFLPIPTRTPVPTITPLSTEERDELCPDLPRGVSLLAGDTVSVYQALSLNSALALQVFHDGRQDWVLGADVERVLKMLDHDVTLAPWSISQRQFFAISVTMREPGDPQCGPPVAPLLFVIDVEADRIGLAEAGKVQAPIPAGFVQEILASLSDVTATPSPRPTRAPWTPGPTRTPLLVPDDAPFFDHPEEELVWDGSDERVRSRDRAHCEQPELHEAYGIPGLIAVDEESGYWPTGASPPPGGLRWTGYHYGKWQIWQGENPKTIYLRHADLRNIVFVYESFGCI